MTQLFRFPDSRKRDPAIETWMEAHTGELGKIARHWFEVMRECGDDVRELLHDGHPTACVSDAAFAYVNAFNAHVNVGFFRGAEISDPDGLAGGHREVHAPCKAQARKRYRRCGLDEASPRGLHRYQKSRASGLHRLAK